ncbi:MULTISPECIES: thiamine diphosphokinase [Acidaminococcus]|uniref:thiamine diphosphokinase n=1 Tax=Acidaminococcus TaxID=904 RepID=UPI0026DEBFD3|nr:MULTISPECIES: thiamine diphosphokinase [Acidaminococcus]MDO5597206.1 thiamine diphosphokinase [Acidaminococcus sp.]
MEKAEFQLPQGTLQLQQETAPAGPPLIVVAGGRRPDPQWLHTVGRLGTVIAADRGADHCKKAGILPRFLYGDRDSAAPGAWEEFLRQGAKAKTYPVNKDDTDLSLVLQDLKPGQQVLATGIWGGRADHLFGNLYTLLAYARRGGTVILADQQELLCYLLPGTRARFTAVKRPRAVSLLPLSPECTVSIHGVRWPLDQAPLTQANPYAVSNKQTEASVEAESHAGTAGLYFTWKE